MTQENFERDLFVIAQNLGELDVQLGRGCDLSADSILELAHLVLAAVQDDVQHGSAWQDSLVAHFSRARDLAFTHTSESIPENSDYLQRINSAVREEGELRLASYLCQLFGDYLPFSLSLDRLVQSDSEEPRRDAREKISYFKNLYADGAFEIFASRLRAPRAIYQAGFEAVCEDVYNGESEFGILPAESTSGGRLTAFYNLIDRYELRIVMSCDVSSADGRDSTRFVLLHKGLLAAASGEEEASAEFLFSPNETFSLGAFLSAAACFGLSLVRVDAVQRPYLENTFNYDVIFSCAYANASRFALYLFLRRSRYTVTGIYPHVIKSK